MKVCFVCSEPKKLDGFYKHPGTLDGHLGKCKECCKQQANQRRLEKLGEIRAYDRQRGCRVSAQKNKNWRKENPEKYKAQTMVGNAVRDAVLERPENCELCGGRSKLHGHHHDYAWPLLIAWVCVVCHKLLHRKGVYND